jgi:hypothetical protein
LILDDFDSHLKSDFYRTLILAATDLLGPWIGQVRGRPYEFDALTGIDTVTNSVELIRVDDKTSDTII